MREIEIKQTVADNSNASPGDAKKRKAINLRATTMKHIAALIAAVIIQAHLALAQVRSPLAYSGKTAWDSATATFTFHHSGSMPNGREDFYWQVPAQAKFIVIESNVTVRGGFRVPFRRPDDPLCILGRDRKTSVIYGTDEKQWTDHRQWHDAVMTKGTS